MMMNRRAFSAALVSGAAASLISTRGMAANSTLVKARNVVLVHGLFADGSCWSEVIPRLQTAGLNVTSVQNPLTTLPEAVASAERVLARQDGPTVLVGHSFSGMIVTEAGVHPNVSALVYVAARAPDAGEDYTALAKTYPTPPASAGIVFDGDEGRLSEEAFLHDFAGDLPTAKAKVLYAVQEPFHKALLTGKTTRRGDRSRVSMPFPPRTARSIRTSSASWPSAWVPRPSRLKRVTCRLSLNLMKSRNSSWRLPACAPEVPVVTTLVRIFLFACEAAGATSTRLSLRPPFREGLVRCTTRAQQCRGDAKSCLRRVLQDVGGDRLHEGG